MSGVTEEICSAALAYRARGWSVIPCRADKKPFYGWSWMKYRYQLPTEDELRSWFTPEVPALAIICGSISGIVVFDVERQGLDWIANLGIPLTCPFVRSQSGGLHFYLRGSMRSCRYDIGKLHVADLKGEGGYVLAPPSRGACGSYTWGIEGELPPVPQAIRDLASAQGHNGGGDRDGGGGGGGGGGERPAVGGTVAASGLPADFEVKLCDVYLGLTRFGGRSTYAASVILAAARSYSAGLT